MKNWNIERKKHKLFDMKNPLVSVITVCFNAEKSILMTMDSVLGQTYPFLEYILIDGGSSDRTLSLIEEKKPLFEAKGIRLVVVSEPDRGIYDAMNKGLSYSKGDWINFMNAGDRFADSRVLEDLFKTDIQPSEQVIYGDTILHLQFGDVTMLPKPIGYMRKKMAFCHQSTLVAGDLMRREKFDLHYRLAADYAFFYRYYQQGGHFRYIHRTIAWYESEEGASSKNRLQVNREYARIQGKADRLSWKLWFVFKVLRVKLKDGLQHCLPQSYVQKMREKNYHRIAKKRLK